MVTQAKRDILSLNKRESFGKGAAGRMRKEHRIPGLVYAGGNDPSHVEVNEKELVHTIKRGSPLVNLTMPDGKQIMATVKEVHLDPITDLPIHVDFQEVHSGEVITVSVPLHTRGECRGTKEGGVLDVQVREVEIRCVPDALPEYLEVDVTDLGIGDSLTLADVPLPEGVELNQDENYHVLSVVPPRLLVEEEEEEEEGEEAPEEGAAEEEGAPPEEETES